MQFQENYDKNPNVKTYENDELPFYGCLILN
jgi:hypothetical protein